MSRCALLTCVLAPVLAAQTEFLPSGKAHVPAVAAYDSAVADVDGDGDLDILPEGEGSLLLNDGSGRFSRAGGVMTIAIGTTGWSTTDFDRDGRVDVFSLRPVPKLFLQVAPRQFVDATFTHLPTLPTSMFDNTSASAACGDVDGDGAPDIAYVPLGSTSHYLLRNDGTGHFALTPPATGFEYFLHPTDVELVDVDGDSDLDVVSSTGTGRRQVGTVLYRNDGSGTFTFAAVLDPAPHEITVANVVEAHAAGAPDLMLGGFAAASRRLLVGRGDGTFESRSAAFTSGAAVPDGGLAAVDVDGDGARDLTIGAVAVVPAASLVASPTGPTVVDRAAMPGYESFDPSPVVADFDRDGDEDLLVGADLLLLNAQDGQFRVAGERPPEFLFDPTGRLLAFADIDGDHLPDALTTQGLARNDGLGSWLPIATPARLIDVSVRGAFADLDRDGAADLVAWRASGPASDRLSVFRGVGDGTFVDTSAVSIPASPALASLQDALTCDFDADGDVDVIFTSSGVGQGTISFLENAGTGTFLQTRAIASVSILPFGDPLRPADIDGDGALDLVQPLPHALLMNRGGTLVDESASRLPSAVLSIAAVGDFIGDGAIDLIGYVTGAWALLENDGRGVFSVASTIQGVPRSAEVVDLDDDGDPDVLGVLMSGVVQTGYGWLRNDGNGGFGPLATIGSGTGWTPVYPALTTDADEDGDLDLYVRGRVIENLTRQVRAPFVASRGDRYQLDVHARATEPPGVRIAAVVISPLRQRLDAGALGVWHLDPTTSFALPPLVLLPWQTVATHAFTVAPSTPVGLQFSVQALILDAATGAVRTTNALSERVE